MARGIGTDARSFKFVCVCVCVCARAIGGNLWRGHLVTRLLSSIRIALGYPICQVTDGLGYFSECFHRTL